MRKLSTGVIAILASLSLAGCLGNIFGDSREPTLSGKNGSITLSKLERTLSNFADREVVIVADACDSVEREACPTAAHRSLAHRLKTMNATAVYDIVTSPSPLGHVVDLYVMINIQHLVWVKEGQALKIWGEKGSAHVTRAFEEVRREMSGIADLAMKPERTASLDQMILRWREQSPQVRFVSMVRFGNLPDTSGKSPLEALSSLFDILNPLDETSQQVEDAKQMAERIFHFAKRLPQIVTWQSETALEEMVSSPEVSRLLDGVNQTSGSIDRITKVVEMLPETLRGERKEILAAWDAREAKIDSSVREIRGTVIEAKALAGQVTQALQAGKDLSLQANELAKTVDQVLKDAAKMSEGPKAAPPGEPAKPFNISEYSAAAGEFTKLVRELNTTLKETSTLLDSPAWVKRQEDFDRLTRQAVGHAGERGQAWVDHLMIRVVEVLVVFFVLLSLYRAFDLRYLRKPREGR